MFQSLKEKWTELANANWNRKIKSFFEKCRWFNIKATTAFDITTTVHWSVPLFLFVFMFISPVKAGVCAIAFLSVIPHEYGHALAARYYGIKTRRIVLYPFGGIAMLVPNKDVKLEKVKELVVAAAGPAVSLSMAIFGWFMLFLNPPDTVDDLGFWFWFFVINTIMVIFNLIPAFPMDGGRILRGFLNLFMSHLRSTQWAYYCSVFVCASLGVLGLLYGSLGLAFTMVLVHMFALMEYTHVIAQETPVEVDVLPPEKK